MQLEVYLGAFSGACFRASWEVAWESVVNDAVSLPSSATGGILAPISGSVIENVVGANGSVLRVNQVASWEQSLECIVMQTESVWLSAAETILESMPGIVLEDVLGGVLGSILSVYLGAFGELTWEWKVQLAGSVPSSAHWECPCQHPWQWDWECNGTRVLGSVLRVYLGASWEFSWGHIVK